MHKKLGVWCEHNFHLYCAKPVIEKYRADHEIIFFTKENCIPWANSYLELPPESIVNIDQLKRRRHVVFKLLFEFLFVNRNFSYVYKKEYVDKEPRIRQIIRAIFSPFNLENNKVNRYFLKYKKLLRVAGLLKTRSFGLDMLISFTKVNYPFLIPDAKCPHISIMESWDHPMKFPYYIDPDVHLTWNKDLADDAAKIQAMRSVRKIEPLKLRYIYEREAVPEEELFGSLRNQRYIEDLQKLKGKKIVMYPTTTSSAGLEHHGEMSLIRDLCRLVENTDFHLYIKPKPNGPEGDYDELQTFPNVIIGEYSSSALASDMLDEEYHTFRYLLLINSEVIVNSGTTFVLEAAAANRKVVQLNISGDKYGSFSMFTHTYHLDKYIMVDGSIPFHGDIDSLRAAVNNCDMAYSNYLKHWITHW